MKTSKRSQGSRQIGAAVAFVEARMALGRVAFSLEELTKETGLSAIAAKFQLLRLRGKVARVSPRQPFFLIVSPEHRNMGAPPADWWLQDYFNWLERPYYLALQSAASAFGSNPQALQVTQVMTDRPCRAIRVGRIQVQFFVKRRIQRTPTQHPAGAVAPLLISTPEATAYDLIRYATRIGGIERAAETIRPLLPLLRARELRRVLDGENEPGVAQPLGCGVGGGHDVGVACQRSPPGCADGREQPERIAPRGLPQARVEGLEQLLRLAIPGPVQVERQLRERRQCRWSSR